MNWIRRRIHETGKKMAGGQGRSLRPAALFLAAAAVVLAAGGLLAQNATVPGKISTPYPTVTNLAVEWLIKGDDNLNATVAVEYRMDGESVWHPGMPLRRIPADKSRGTNPIFLWENKFSGSVFDLKPGTGYEIRLKLKDPDGGAADTTVRVSTRPIPRAAADGTVKKVNADTFEEAAALAQPGDILLLTPGFYGEYRATRDGKPGRPIVIRSDKADPLVNSTFEKMDLSGRKNLIIEGVTVTGSVELLGAEDIAVRRCTVNAQYGIIAKSTPGAKNCYIADNTVTYVMPWTKLAMGCCMTYGGAACVGEGIEMTGPGNVICHNRVKGYRDCISTMEDLWVYDQRCIDIYNNDISVGDDDGVEADFAQGNCRIMRNRLTNCGMGLSSQPGLGGPTYFIRNVMYNIIYNPFKLSRGTKGDVVLHNTVIKVGDGWHVSHNPSLAYFRNNLMLGGTGGGTYGRFPAGDGLAINFARVEKGCDMDYDGVGTVGTPFAGLLGKVRFSSLEELRRLTPEKHAVQVDLGVFAAKVDFPDPPVPERQPADLRLKPGSAAVDAGVAIPNINDSFSGKAPDLGAYELGAEPTLYGPRPEGQDEETMWLESHKSGN
jgi:hypothetical protein